VYSGWTLGRGPDRPYVPVKSKRHPAEEHLAGPRGIASRETVRPCRRPREGDRVLRRSRNQEVPKLFCLVGSVSEVDRA
jgi:hypothetical protein